MGKYHKVVNEIEEESLKAHVMDENAVNSLKKTFGKGTPDNLAGIFQSVFNGGFMAGMQEALKIIRKQR